MRPHRNRATIRLPATVAQILDQLLRRLQLRSRRLIAIEIAHQANPERDVVQIIAVHMTAVDLPRPAVAHFHLPVAGRSPVADHEMVRQPVLHPPHPAVIIIKRARVALPRPAIMHDNKFPARTLHRRAADCLDHAPAQVAIGLLLASAATEDARPNSAPRRRRRRRFKPMLLLDTGFLDRDVGRGQDWYARRRRRGAPGCGTLLGRGRATRCFLIRPSPRSRLRCRLGCFLPLRFARSRVLVFLRRRFLFRRRCRFFLRGRAPRFLFLRGRLRFAARLGRFARS